MADVEFIDNSDKFEEAMADAIPAILEAIGMDIEREAKLGIRGDFGDPERIDTGLLRNSITYALSGESAAIDSYEDDDGKQKGTYSGTAPKEGLLGTGLFAGSKQAVYIGTNVEYAPYVHEGTKRMTPNRFLKNAVERNKDKIEKYIKDGLKNA